MKYYRKQSRNKRRRIQSQGVELTNLINQREPALIDALNAYQRFANETDRAPPNQSALWREIDRVTGQHLGNTIRHQTWQLGALNDRLQTAVDRDRAVSELNTLVNLNALRVPQNIYANILEYL